MNMDEIRHQPPTARGMPRAAILAAIDQAQALEIVGSVELAADKAMPTPPELFMFCGIHALAAVGRNEPVLAGRRANIRSAAVRPRRAS